MAKLLLLVLALCLQHVSAASWYFLRWTTPSKQYQFQKFSMQMVIPPIKGKGVYYLWPGLQDTANTGVYQHVLDGRTGAWRIAAGWCCQNPSLPWGDGFSVSPGAKVQITMSKNGNSWTSTTASGSNSKTNTFPLGTKNMNQALLAIELYDVKWDFGPLTWNNVVMVMNTTETKWCTNAPENYGGSTTYTMTKPRVSTSGKTTTCTIDQVVLQKPAK